MKDRPEPWWNKPLSQLNREQWEAVCDGCARCCLQKLEDSDTEQTFFTRIACRLLDLQTCRCSDYENRFHKVDDCTQIAPLNEAKRKWLPNSCAYLRLMDGKGLPVWHHLVCGNSNEVHSVGVSVRDWAVSENVVHERQYEDMIIEFNEKDDLLSGRPDFPVTNDNLS